MKNCFLFYFIGDLNDNKDNKRWVLSGSEFQTSGACTGRIVSHHFSGWHVLVRYTARHFGEEEVNNQVGGWLVVVVGGGEVLKLGSINFYKCLWIKATATSKTTTTAKATATTKATATIKTAITTAITEATTTTTTKQQQQQQQQQRQQQQQQICKDNWAAAQAKKRMIEILSRSQWKIPSFRYPLLPQKPLLEVLKSSKTYSPLDPYIPNKYV